jgi:hypothetical protein
MQPLRGMQASWDLRFALRLFVIGAQISRPLSLGTELNTELELFTVALHPRLHPVFVWYVMPSYMSSSHRAERTLKVYCLHLAIGARGGSIMASARGPLRPAGVF